MPHRRVDDSLQVILRLKVGIRSRNRGKLALRQPRLCLGKHEIRVEIWVVIAAAISRVPTRIQRQLHQVREARFAARSRGTAAWQSTKALQVDGIGAFGHQISIQEVLVRELVIRVVVDVLRKIVVDCFKLLRIRFVATSTWNFAVLHSRQLVVLHPEICLQDFCCGSEPEQRGITFCQSSPMLLRIIAAK